MTPTIYEGTGEVQVAEGFEPCAVCGLPAGNEVPLRLYVHQPEQPICRNCIPQFPGLEDPLILG